MKILIVWERKSDSFPFILAVGSVCLSVHGNGAWPGGKEIQPWRQRERGRKQIKFSFMDKEVCTGLILLAMHLTLGRLRRKYFSAC